jgi:hypothetical protein
MYLLRIYYLLRRSRAVFHFRFEQSRDILPCQKSADRCIEDPPIHDLVTTAEKASIRSDLIKRSRVRVTQPLRGI